MLVLSLFFEGKEGSSPEEGHVIPGTEFPHLLLKFKNTHKRWNLQAGLKESSGQSPLNLRVMTVLLLQKQSMGLWGSWNFTIYLCRIL